MPTDSWQSFVAASSGSQKLYDAALKLLPGGVSHNNRKVLGFPIYVDRANGARKTDVDGNEFVDYSMGSASLVLGHAPPSVIEAIGARLTRGTGTTDCHELEVEWARLVTELIPCADMVRFVASGTEATQLAMRLARAATGRTTIARIEGHYLGWHDYALAGFQPGTSEPPSAGVPAEIGSTVVVANCNDPVGELEQHFENGDVAAVFLEPSGGRWGALPLPDGTLGELRRLTNQYGVLLVFDEVITGFRYAPGGAQQRFGITPDLSTLGKVLTGGLPGGAIAGRSDIMSLLAPNKHQPSRSVFHFGTFNANPITAAAGIATLNALRDGEALQEADNYAKQLRAELARIISELRIDGFVYGESSQYHVFLNAPGTTPLKPDDGGDRRRYLGMEPNIVEALQRELWAHGVDPLSYNGGVTSSAHGPRELTETVAAYHASLTNLLERDVVRTVR